jgi:hypothetical protein
MYDQTNYNKDFQAAYIEGGWIMLRMLKWKNKSLQKDLYQNDQCTKNL